MAQKKKYLGVGWLPSLYAATFSSWFCYSLLHADCSLLLLLDMFCFSSLRQDGLLLLCE